MRVRTIQTNFTAGEITPRMKGRVDVARYQNGADILENGIPVVHGGVDRRGGFRYLGTTKLDGASGARVIPYVFNQSQAFVAEFGDHYIRLFTSDGAVVLNDALATLELVSPYSAAQVPDITYVQGADTMFLFHGEVPTQRLRRLSATQWDISPVPWITEPFNEQGHAPDASLTLSAASVGVGRTFTAGALSAPGAPTIGTAVPLNAAANVAFTPPGSTGGSPITQYTATSTPGGFTGTDTASPIRVPGLANGVAYTFKVKATNSFGTGAESAASNSVTPLASLPGVSITVTASPSDFVGFYPNGVKSNILASTASASGGIAPYSFLWTKLSGPASIVATTVDQAGLVLRSTAYDNEAFASFRVTATDASGATGTFDVNVDIAHGTP